MHMSNKVIVSVYKVAAHKAQLTALENQHIRMLSSQQRPKGFLSGFFDHLKEEYHKNKEMKDSIKKFRQEAQKLEDSDALKEARKKYKELEEEKERSSKILKEKLENLTEKVKESDIGKKAAEFSEEMAKQAQKAAENLSKQTQELSKTAAFKKVTENVKAIRENIDEATQLSQVRPYVRPSKLRKRSEVEEHLKAKVYESNTTDTGMVLHKDSKFYQSWVNFKENNPYINKLFEFKTQYDESDNIMVRGTRAITEKFSSVFGGIFKSTEMSEVLNEIIKVEPTFEMHDFLKRVQNDIIPNIMEALSQQDHEILKDWCTEAAYNMLVQPIVQCEQLKFKYFNHVLDISNLDVAASKLMEQGPVLIVTFTAQQILYVTDSHGKIVEGDKEKIKRINHVWALCRDQNIHDPSAAWRLMECASHQSEQFV